MLGQYSAAVRSAGHVDEFRENLVPRYPGDWYAVAECDLCKTLQLIDTGVEIGREDL